MYKLGGTSFMRSKHSYYFVFQRRLKLQRMAAGFFFRLFVILLGLSCLVNTSNGVPITRIGRLMQGSQVYDEAQGITENKIWDEQTLRGRMDVELHDYPGSGANNRHTPKPQYGRCADC